MSTFGRFSLFGAALLVAIACGGLGVWQLDRLATRRAANRAALAQRDLPALDLNRESPPAALTYRRATAAGSYDFEREFLLRGRVLLGAPGVQVVTPLRMPGRDTAVLVNRGFVPTQDAGPPGEGIAYREPASTTVDGVVLRAPDAGDGAPMTMPRGESWQRIDLTGMRNRLPYPVAWYYVIATADTGRTVDHTARGTVLPLRIEPPALDDGPHLSYAIQWFLIGGAALAFGVIFALRRGRDTQPDIAPPPGG